MSMNRLFRSEHDIIPYKFKKTTLFNLVGHGMAFFGLLIALSGCGVTSYSVVWTVPQTNIAVAVLDVATATKGLCMQHVHQAVDHLQQQIHRSTYGLGDALFMASLNSQTVGCLPTKSIKTGSFYRLVITDYSVNQIQKSSALCASCWHLIRFNAKTQTFQDAQGNPIQNVQVNIGLPLENILLQLQ